VVGAERVRQALTDTADLLDSLVDQTLAVMNAGGRLDDAIHSVLPPAELEARPYLRPVYDEPEFVVHTVWRQYGGWWDGNPATLKPAPERALARELATLAGGAGALAERALELLALAESAEANSDANHGQPDQALRLAGHLAESAWLAEPGDAATQRARQQVFAARATRATSTMARGVFNWAASESVPESPDAGASDHGSPADGHAR
jgi:alkyl sulfatase BDS1-like metallo-beta-lactamase superfamily hydrolase